MSENSFLNESTIDSSEEERPLDHDVRHGHDVYQGRVGHKLTDVWRHLTDTRNPQKLILAACKHCTRQVVTYQRARSWKGQDDTS